MKKPILHDDIFFLVKKFAIENNKIKAQDTANLSIHYELNAFLNSLDIVEITMLMEEKFDICIGDNEVESWHTINDIAKCVLAHINAKNPQHADVVVMATFIGTNSLGYEHNTAYTLKLQEKDGMSIRRIDGSGKCEYTSLFTFLQNWHNIKQL